MLILILILSILLTILCMVCIDDFDLSSGGSAFFLIISLISIIALICCTTKLVGYRVIDDKIKLYQKQNKEIEQKIELVVKEYKDFEKDTFTGLKSDSYITLVNLYPELKSDKMVQQQIDLYTKNNKKITSLKEEKINRTIYRWWVYFGK